MTDSEYRCTKHNVQVQEVHGQLNCPSGSTSCEPHWTTN